MKGSSKQLIEEYADLYYDLTIKMFGISVSKEKIIEHAIRQFSFGQIDDDFITQTNKQLKQEIEELDGDKNVQYNLFKDNQ